MYLCNSERALRSNHCKKLRPMIIAPVEHDAPFESLDPTELLIKEARIRTRKRRRRIGLAILVVVGSVAVWALSGGFDGHSPSLRASGGTQKGSATSSLNSTARNIVYPYALCGDSDMAVSGSHIWLVGCTFKSHSIFSARVQSVTELNASNGSLVRVVETRADGFDYPNYIAVSPRDVWVANDNSTVTELNASNGSLVRVLSAKADGFDAIAGIAAVGSHVWVSSANNNDLTELNANTGSLVRVVRLKGVEISGTGGIEVYGSYMWLTNGSDNSVIQLNANTGSLVRVIKGAKYGFNGPSDVVERGSRVWVTSGWGPPYTTPKASTQPNQYGGSVTELNANSGAVVRVIKSKADHFYGSSSITIDGSHLWIANSYGNSLTELNANNGSLLRVIKTNDSDYSGGPSVVVVSGSHTWALSGSFSLSSQYDLWGSSLTELNASNGSIVRTIK